MDKSSNSSKFSTFKVNPLDISKWFINSTDLEAGDVMTHLKLQKLIYYAQGWSLALKNTLLFRNDLEAWAHGPVSREVYDEFSEYRFSPILPDTDGNYSSISDTVTDLLDDVYTEYSQFSAKRLENMTHQETPWLNARGNLPAGHRSTDPIDYKDMKVFFDKLNTTGFDYR